MRVIGFRAWQGDESQGGWLRSWVFQESVWRVGVNVARCEGFTGGGFAGQRNCPGPPSQHGNGTMGCGFHAFGHLSGLEIYLRHQRDAEAIHGVVVPSPMGGLICGVVAGSGRVQLGSLGWRASRAEVVALFGAAPLAELLAERYRVPLLPIPTDLDRTERFSREWGLSHDEALALP